MSSDGDDINTTLDKKAKAKRALRIAAIVGMILGLVCKMLPPKYQQPCETLSQVFSLTCGG